MLVNSSLAHGVLKNKIPVRPSGYLSGYLAVRTWILAVGKITFEGFSGSKQNLVGVFYV